MIEKLRGNGVIFFLMPFPSLIFFPIWKGKKMHLEGKLYPSYFPSSPFSPPNQTRKNQPFFFIFSFHLFHFFPFHSNQTPLRLLYVVKQSIRFIVCSCWTLEHRLFWFNYVTVIMHSRYWL